MPDPHLKPGTQGSKAEPQRPWADTVIVIVIEKVRVAIVIVVIGIVILSKGRAQLLTTSVTTALPA